ncbi:hypothetical protein KNE206_37160 [Kitasatospora sp. NE20-6]|uniref:hypothetical protein n=1 Tax=Kitasatospora sp. NE20-6 TaxID=2859066 RepID=UPI0034DC6D4A
MGRAYHFHREYEDCSVTVGVRLGRHPEVELLVDGKEVGLERVHDRHVEQVVLSTTLPTYPPRPAEVRVDLAGGKDGVPVCVLVADGTELPVPEREIPRHARPTEASWYG